MCQQTWQRTRWDCAYLSIELLANGADPHFSSLPIFQLLIQFFLHNSHKNVWMYYLNGLLLYLPNNMQFSKIHNVWIRGTKEFFLNTWRLMTSRRVAGALETRWIQIWSPCVHCLQTQHWWIIKIHETLNNFALDGKKKLHSWMVAVFTGVVRWSRGYLQLEIHLVVDLVAVEEFWLPAI